MIPTQRPTRLSSTLRSLTAEQEPLARGQMAPQAGAPDRAGTTRETQPHDHAAPLEPALWVADAQRSANTVPHVPANPVVVPGCEKVRFQIANTRTLREMAYRLVHQMYLDRGYACSARDGLWFQLHHALPQTLTLLALRDGKAVATLSVVPDSALGLPGDAIFPERLATLRAQGNRLCEFTSLALGQAPEADSRPLLLNLFALAFAGARHLGIDNVTVTFMSHHELFYRRVLLFDEISPDSRISPKTGAPVRLGRLDVRQAPRRYRERYGTAPSPRNLYRQLWESQQGLDIAGWIREQHLPLSVEDLRYFGIERGTLRMPADPEPWARLQAHYPPAEWERVMGREPALPQPETERARPISQTNLAWAPETCK